MITNKLHANLNTWRRIMLRMHQLPSKNVKKLFLIIHLTRTSFSSFHFVIAKNENDLPFFHSFYILHSKFKNFPLMHIKTKFISVGYYFFFV